MKPLREFEITRRNLPHWQAPGATYFITWRVRDGFVLLPDERTLVLDAVKHWDGTRWRVYAAVVMPDHVHVLAYPLPLDLTNPAASEFHDLGELVGSVKKFSARKINERRGRRGAFWLDERYDRIPRHEREFEDTWGYIRSNPVGAGLVERPEEYVWWYEAGRAD